VGELTRREKEMPTHKTRAFGHQICRSLLHDSERLTDGQLLGRFIDHQDEESFAALLQQHGPMVWSVCRRLLGHHDAEDAFQVTFLVLVRKAHAIHPRELVANWLYGVAHQAALQARRTATRRKTREAPMTETPEPGAVEPESWDDLLPVLDQELSHLPNRYRTVVVLCDLEGKTRKEVARQLGLPEGTVASRLMRARTLLAKRLGRHGRALSGGAVALALAQNLARAVVPHRVVSCTRKAARLLATGQAAPGAIPATVAASVEGVMKTMLVSKLKTIAVLLLGVGLTVAAVPLGSALLAPGIRAAEPSGARKDPPKAPPAGTENTKPSRTEPEPADPPLPKAPRASDEPRLDGHLAAWEKQTDGIANLHVEIALKRTDAVCKKEREYTGAALYMKPNLGVMRLDPTGDKVAYEAYICDGKNLYAYSGKDKSITVLKQPPDQGLWTDHIPALGFLTGAKVKGLKERYTVTLVKTDAHYIYLDVKPRRAADQRDFTSLRLALYGPGVATAKWAYLPAQAHVVTPNGDTETWKFTNPKVNSPGVTEKNFAFVPLTGWKIERAPAPETPEDEHIRPNEP
jgi:TIGR03009 family protein